VDDKSYHEWTPLHLAARYGRVAILHELVRAGADVNGRGFHGWTSLHYAARSGYLEIIEVLLNAGAEAGALDNDKRTAA
jgi:ankyrin repeat protein